jgi:hypothetical protein
MGKAEERCRVDRAVVCEESLIWFEGVPVVVCDERMAAGFFDLCNMHKRKREIQRAISNTS